MEFIGIKKKEKNDNKDSSSSINKKIATKKRKRKLSESDSLHSVENLQQNGSCLFIKLWNLPFPAQWLANFFSKIPRWGTKKIFKTSLQKFFEGFKIFI